MHLINPGYAKNQQKIEERFHSMAHANDEIDSGIKTGINAD